MDLSPPILVSIGLIRRGGRYLIRRRPPLPDSPMPGRWEFPGGKCEPDERIEDALLRECFEETGLAVRILRMRCVIEHRYPHGFVKLHYFDCEAENPTAEPSVSSGFLWAEAASLPQLDFPEANQPILEDLAKAASRTPVSAHLKPIETRGER